MNSNLPRLTVALIIFLGLHASAAWGSCSPIVVDVGKNGIELGSAGVGVYFDVDNNGRPNHVQWVKAGGDEAFLALDRNGNGIVDNGSELFGVGTPMIFEGTNAPNGFVGLAQYDSIELGGNDDGYITNDDAIWSALRLWRDINADGISAGDEMFTPEAFRDHIVRDHSQVRQALRPCGKHPSLLGVGCGHGPTKEGGDGRRLFPRDIAAQHLSYPHGCVIAIAAPRTRLTNFPPA